MSFFWGLIWVNLVDLGFGTPQNPSQILVMVQHMAPHGRPDGRHQAILCACDAIMDGGFVLREVQLAGPARQHYPLVN